MFLGSDIGWVDVMDYHDADRSCTISMPELANVCRAHYDACIRFLDSSHTTKGARSTPRPPSCGLSPRCFRELYTTKVAVTPKGGRWCL